MRPHNMTCHAVTRFQMRQVGTKCCNLQLHNRELEEKKWTTQEGHLHTMNPKRSKS